MGMEKVGIVTRFLTVACLVAASFAVFAQKEQPATSALNENQPVQTLIGRVSNVLSGDTLQLLLPDGDLVFIRLAGITSPAITEALGKRSHAWLSGELLDRLVSAQCEQNDDTFLCVVFPDDRDINRISLYRGYSICDTKKSSVHNQQLYTLAEQHARDEKIGLWASN